MNVDPTESVWWYNNWYKNKDGRLDPAREAQPTDLDRPSDVASRQSIATNFVICAGFLCFAVLSTARAAAENSADTAKLESPAVFAAYCKTVEASAELGRQADEKFGVSPDADEWEKKTEWQASRDEALAHKLAEEVGIASETLWGYAYEHEWTQKCRAQAAGREVIEAEQLKAATDEDATRAEDALTLHYIWRLEKDPDPYYFNPELYGAVGCRYREVTEFKLIACHLRALLRKSENDYYLVARSKNNEIVIVPYSGEARGRVEAVKSLQDVEGKSVLLGAYVGPPLDYQALVAEFE